MIKYMYSIYTLLENGGLYNSASSRNSKQALLSNNTIEAKKSCFGALQKYYE